ncbi:ubiquitin-like-conjugating enzyme ATG10 isoform X2 [Limulus polyphemus]|uniref:Ubiquitin-like-conjugating enzyme ATG10 n=1 Tax=Limulus polyphemus TaxID=6850 RepID=A0ABM1SB02_LIMPO|nr:ubiquitin-like-conjugating enzyme ATG10 isoform X2 [Limulus polyphemus]
MSGYISWENFLFEIKNFQAASSSLRDGWELRVLKVLASDASNRLVTFEYHVIYSISYSVPVLYFTAWRQDGTPLSLEEVWDQVPRCYQEQLKQQRWSILTQQQLPLIMVEYR